MTLTFNGKAVAGFVLGMLLGAGISGAVVRKIYRDRTATEMVARDTAIRKALYEDFRTPGTPGDMPAIIQSMDVWTLLAESGTDYKRQSEQALQGFELVNRCIATHGTFGFPEVAQQTTPTVASTPTAADWLEVLKPGAGKLLKRYQETHRP